MLHPFVSSKNLRLFIATTLQLSGKGPVDRDQTYRFFGFVWDPVMGGGVGKKKGSWIPGSQYSAGLINI